MSDRTCVECGGTKPIEDFSLLPNKKYRRRRCKSCRASARTEKNESLSGTQRSCTACHDTKPIELFPRHGDRGRHHQCCECRAKDRREWRGKLKSQAVQAYGGRCECCGESELVFLTVDHKNNDGSRHRDTISSDQIYKWLRDNNYPDGFRLLCFNCNFAEYWGGCPHKRQTGDPDVR